MKPFAFLLSLIVVIALALGLSFWSLADLKKQVVSVVGKAA